MKNSMIPESEIKILGEIFEKIDELVENHNNFPLTLAKVGDSSEAEQVHIVIYMDYVRDLITATNSLRGLLEISEEDFLDVVTDEGKITLGDVRRKMMTKMLIDMLEG